MIANSFKKVAKILGDRYKHIFGGQNLEDDSIEGIIEKTVNYYESIIGCMPGNVYWLDKNCISLGCNQNVLDMFGFKSINEFKGLNFEDMGRLARWSKEAEQSFKNDTLEVIRTGKPKLNIEEPPILHNDGRLIHFLTSRVPLFDHLGEMIGVVGISVDISDKRRAETLVKEKQIIEEKMHSMNTLAASIAHELRTPLRTISSAASAVEKYYSILIHAYELAKKEKLPVEKIHPLHYQALPSACQNIESEARGAFTVIDMLLANLNRVQKPESIPESLKICSIKETIDDAVRRYPFDGGERDLIDLSGVQDFRFKGDEILLIHVFFNLFRNAFYQIKAAGKGTIHLWTDANDEYNKVHFKDTANGMSLEVLSQVFDLFFTRTNHGTGIGLTFCKNIMERLGGNIICESSEGIYAEFILYFPKIK